MDRREEIRDGAVQIGDKDESEVGENEAEEEGEEVLNCLRSWSNVRSSRASDEVPLLTYRIVVAVVAGSVQQSIGEVPTIRGSESKGTPGVHPPHAPGRCQAQMPTQQTVPIQRRGSGARHTGCPFMANEAPTITQGDTQCGVDQIL